MPKRPKESLWYLCTPYSEFHAGRQAAFEVAAGLVIRAAPTHPMDHRPLDIECAGAALSCGVDCE